MEGKLNKTRHPFSKELSWEIPSNFQPIPSEDARKQTKNIHHLCAVLFYREIDYFLRRGLFGDALKVKASQP